MVDCWWSNSQARKSLLLQLCGVLSWCGYAHPCPLCYQQTDRGEKAADETKKWVSGLETIENVPIASLEPGEAEQSWATFNISEDLSVFVTN